MRRFLLLDDEIYVLHALKRTLRQFFSSKSIHVETFTDPERALLRIGEVSFDVVVSDYRMPDIDGIEFLKAVKRIQPESVRLILSASTEFDTVMNAINQAEVFRYIAKPWQESDILNAFQLALQRYDEGIEDRRLASELRIKHEQLSAQELEARRLEELEPGITKVEWGPDGSVYLEDDPDNPRSR